jgi:signal transduction histidine kinase
MATGAGDPRADIESIAREIAQLYRASMASVFVHNNGSGPRHVTGYGVSPRFLRTLEPLGADWDSLVPPDVHEPVIISNVAADGPTKGICHWASSAGIATLALAPISAGGHTLGALALYHRDHFDYGEEDRLVLHALAGLASQVVSRARLAGAHEGEGSNSVLFSVLGHELRTPLTSIMGFTQMIRKRLYTAAPDDTRLREHVEVLWVQSQRLNRLIDSFVDLGRIERGDFHIEPARFELTQLLRVVADQTISQAGSRHTLKLDLPAQPVWLYGDAHRIEQVFSHLLMNAAKYSSADIPIEMVCETGPGTGKVVVRITDHGPGIPTTRIKEIFQDRYPMGPLKAGGLGVGLYLSKVIVEAHAGHVDLDSSPGGTTVSVTLPLQRDAADTHRTHSTPGG